MMKAGTETGSLTNYIYSRTVVKNSDGSNLEVKPGVGATILGWTDRHAATVVKVTPTQIHVQVDRAIRLDSNGVSETQQYRYEPQPNAPVEIFRKTKRGYRNAAGSGLLIGAREEYYDYSF